MTQKQCTKCKQIKHIEEFRFLKNLGRRMAECKKCEYERQRAWKRIQKKRPTKRELAVREVAILCKLFDTGILQEAVTLLQEDKL